MQFLFIQCGFASVTRQGFCEIVAADESGRIENGSANHDSDRRHCVYTGFTHWLSHSCRRSACVRVHSHVGWEDFLVLQVFFQGDAASHDGCELDVVHNICTGIFGQVFFDDFATNPANPSNKASDGCSVEERFDELVVRHGVSIHRVYFQDSFDSSSSSYSGCVIHSTAAFAMSQVISVAGQLTRQSVCMTLLFIATTAEVNPPTAIPVRAPFITTSMASPRVWPFMAWGIYRV